MKDIIIDFETFATTQNAAVIDLAVIAYDPNPAFDFPILVDLIRDAYRSEGVPENEIDTSKLEPVKFWNQRDIRTAIEAYSLTRGLSMCPLPNGTLKGFVAHDSIHDCAKDILMLKYAQRYALSLEDVPENPDPLSIKNR
ncbi:exonuclease [Escherichia phage vB_EcoM_005]|uniref:Exonuclease n=1 Tax=Escherichia phage vB_EcoM_005 TaxID=2500761 RepID=A0A3Q9R9Z8_9CAUD|nr:exonuclease [Escherichia phage vB_EcoM_005]AZV01102.1 exonuclease [Escherichia phage vB_EcoM_005]